MPAHVDHQHVLRLEGLLLSRAILPPTHKLFLLPMDVVIVDVLRKKTNHFNKAISVLLKAPAGSVHVNVADKEQR